MKKFLLAVLLGVATALGPVPSALALTRVDLDAFESGINRGDKNMQARYSMGTQMVTEKRGVIRACYDFSVSGGAISTIVLKGSNCTGTPTLPSGAIVTNVIIDTVTAPTSGGSATIAVGTGQTGVDLKAATAYASFTALLVGIPINTVATAIKLTADRNPTITIATAALTAGKFYVIIEYVLSKTT